MTKSRKPSMNDVARHAGVSQTTVSLVLNGVEESGIPTATRERVLAAVGEVGYRTNRLARAMRLNRTDTIGFIADDMATTPYANRMIKGAQDAAWEAERLLLIVSTGSIHDPGQAAMEQAALQQLLERQVDGVVYGAMYHRVVDAPALLGDAPRAVLLDCRDPHAEYPSVVPDEFRAAYDATTHLLDHGHRRIAHLTIDPTLGAAVERRRAGYRQALEDAGVTVDEALVIEDESTASGGRRCLARAIEIPDRPTAVFCFNDQYAMGVYQAAREAGLRIPDDLSVVGFDDQLLIAAELVPGLTTMRLPHYEMGRWAINALLDPSVTPPQQELRCDRVDRGSVVTLSH